MAAGRLRRVVGQLAALALTATAVIVGLATGPASATATLGNTHLDLPDNPIFERVYGPADPTACGIGATSQPSFTGQARVSSGSFPGTMTFSGQVGIAS